MWSGASRVWTWHYGRHHRLKVLTAAADDADGCRFVGMWRAPHPLGGASGFLQHGAIGVDWSLLWPLVLSFPPGPVVLQEWAVADVGRGCHRLPWVWGHSAPLAELCVPATVF